MKVLITGAAGKVGRYVVHELADRHDIRLLDVKPMNDLLGEAIQGDITDWETVHRAVEGMDGIAHLAVFSPYLAGKMARHVYYEKELKVDVLGTDLLAQAAVECGVKRFVYVSSNSVYCAMYPGEGETLEESTRPLSQTHYGMCKYLAEEVCRRYAQAHGLSCVVLRLNSVTFPEEWERDKDQDTRDGACSRVHILDVARAVRIALEKEGLKWEVCSVSGDNPERRWPIDRAREVLGFMPEYGFDVGRMFRHGKPYP